ncbi:MAG: hypothetical protein G5663_03195 [Serratia symbiotica]|nr:hypothetical protein [Serratia symbiotica]
MQSVNVPFKNLTPCKIAQLAIASTGINVLDAGQWKVKKRSGETADLAKTAFGRR